jgi:hypothetical protein
MAIWHILWSFWYVVPRKIWQSWFPVKKAFVARDVLGKEKLGLK